MSNVPGLAWRQLRLEGGRLVGDTTGVASQP